MDYLISLLKQNCSPTGYLSYFLSGKELGMVGSTLDSTSYKLRPRIHACFCPQGLLSLLLGSVLQCLQMQGGLLGPRATWATWEEAHCQSPGQSSITHTWYLEPALPYQPFQGGQLSSLGPPVCYQGVLGPDKPPPAHMAVCALHTNRIFHLK